MPSIARSTHHHKRSSLRRFWRHNFLGRVLLLALSSGVGGFLVGGLAGVASSSGSLLVLASNKGWWAGLAVVSSVWGIEMMLLGFLVGVVVFAGVGRSSSQWSASHKGRFARGMKARVFLPLLSSLIAIPFLAALFWTVWQQSFVRPLPVLALVLFSAQMATVPLATGLFVWLLARSSQTSRPRQKTPVRAERLLPLD